MSISRDPRAGDRAVPVFFIGMPDAETLHQFVPQLYEGTGLKLLCHVQAGETLSYLVVPALFHLFDVDDFVNRVTAVLRARERANDVAWFCDLCEVGITHRGRRYNAVRDSAGRLNVLE